MTLASTGSTSLDLGKPVEDETFCGPICQHPACWQSKQRKEKGFPRYTCLAQSLPEPLETDLPNLTMYNLLEDYGHDPSDRYPVRFDGHWLYHTEDDKDAAISARPRKPLPPTPRSNGRCVEHVPELHVVEVQEVFDLDDLNNKWDETFLTKQCYMWVPNPSRTPRVTTESLQSPPTSAIEAAYRQHPVLVKDHTEEMMPQEIERHREQTKVFDEFPVIKKKISQGSSLVHPRTLIRTPRLSSSGKPRVDTEGLKDLLNLPRDVLMQVLDHLRESDFTSKEKVRSVIQRVRPQVEPVVAKGRLSPIAPVFVQQQKVKLLQGKTRNVRQPSVITQPVFQLDNDDKHSDDLQVKGLGRDRDRDVSKDVYTSSEIETRDAYSLQGFAKYRKALPEIGTIAYSEGGCSPRLYRSKLPSVSLGLPELPFGVSQIRPFTYKNRQYLDLSIGPVPSPPSTSCSSEFGGSDHGTTVRPNMTSASTRLDKDLYGVVYDPQYTKPKSPRGTLRSRSPARSSRTRKSPHHLVASRQSVPKSASGQHAADKAREISMSPVPKFQAPANSPNQSPTTSPPPPVISVTSGLNEASMVPCVNDSEQKMFSEGPIISKVPVVEDTVKEAEKPETKPLTDTVPTDSELMKADEPETCSPALYVAPEYPSPDVWPEVSEAAYELASMPASKEETEQASSSEQLIQIPTSTSRSKSNGKESDRESLVRKMMDDTKNVQSPAPPPPSPELKGLKKAESAQGKSHDSLVMEPLYEECGEVVDSLASAPAAGESPVEDDPGTATYVSHVAPLGSSHRGNEMTEHSFVNVDIPADMPPGSDKTNGDGTVRSSLKSDADGTTYRSNIPSSAGVSAAGYITERTLTGEIASDECEDSSPDLLFKGRMPVSKTTNGSMTQGVLPETSKREVLEDSESTTDTEKINMEPRPCNAPREIDGAESDFFMGEADIIRTSTDNDDDQGQDIQVSDPVDADSSESKMNTEAPVSNERVAGETPGGDVREEEEVVTGQVEEQAGDAAGEGEAKDTDQDISNEQH
ncbi:uncharacterized protein LOC121383139 isoform X6 [Gigantopelta aegis]|uniref:uncharacterized protein LOC121383139 isoform X6 n=1 Tax=Gigantopelta aegis TaxID=1735272 RepID=UPI001B88A487|nr:uncharacterized protein LOC121383139 isoform X6 [Gigantopelta aegis]